MITDDESEAVWEALQDLNEHMKDLHDQLEALEAKVEGLKLVCGVLCDKLLPRV